MRTRKQFVNDGVDIECLIHAASARIKYTGQIVELKKVSEHGISIIAFRTGGEYFISNKYLEPVTLAH